MDEGVASSDFDIVSGAAGILAYLVSIEQADPTIQRAIAHLLAYLLWLGEPGQPPGQERWYIPPALLPGELHRQLAPRGNFNCGLSHGIPGPLAALSLTWLAGYRSPGLRETIAYLADWVAEHRIEREWGIDWHAIGERHDSPGLATAPSNALRLVLWIARSGAQPLVSRMYPGERDTAPAGRKGH